MKTQATLPHQSKQLFLTDGGLETTLVFEEEIDLPYFAAIDMLNTEEGKQLLRAYYRGYAHYAKTHDTGFVLESATWRASPDWAEKLGYSQTQLKALNQAAINLCQEIRDDYQTSTSPMPISGNLGPRGDGYVVSERMSDDEAMSYHSTQIGFLKLAGVDFVSAFTINYTEEAVGIVKAAQAHDLPVVISFTVETDGHLPSGQALSEAILQVDKNTKTHPIYYMINCAHPTHFAAKLNQDDAWLNRIGGIRANASCKSHAELDASTTLDKGNPSELGSHYSSLLKRLPNVNVLGGCCGTSHDHIEAIHQQCEHYFDVV